QRSGLGAFFELPDRTVRPHFVRHIGVGPFGIGFAPIDLEADETARLAVELAGDRDPAPLGKLQREAALLALGLPSPGLALEGALDRRADPGRACRRIGRFETPWCAARRCRATPSRSSCRPRSTTSAQ